jgi:hypothetical protein
MSKAELKKRFNKHGRSISQLVQEIGNKVESLLLKLKGFVQVKFIGL